MLFGWRKRDVALKSYSEFVVQNRLFNFAPQRDQIAPSAFGFELLAQEALPSADLHCPDAAPESASAEAVGLLQ
jgi:hypothetical protein